MQDYTESIPLARQLVADEFVVSGAEIVRCDKPDKPAVMMDPLDMGPEIVDQWNECGFDIVVPPIASFKPDYHQENFRLISGMNAFIAGHGDRVMRIDCSDDFQRAKDSGRVGIVICVHQSEHFRTVDDVDLFHSYGQRSSLITSHGQNSLGSSVGERADGGLSNFGVAAVRRMNEVGMVVDVSHCAERTAMDCVEVSSKPVLCSHANAAAICPNPRNKNDEFIKAMAARGGVMGVMCLRMLVTPNEPTGIEDVIDHIDYIINLVGPEHAGLGFEVPTFGWDDLYAGSEHPVPLPGYMRNKGVQRKLDIPELSTPQRMTILAAAMLNRGWSADVVGGVIGGNFRRAMSEILQ